MKFFSFERKTMINNTFFILGFKIQLKRATAEKSNLVHHTILSSKPLQGTAFPREDRETFPVLLPIFTYC